VNHLGGDSTLQKKMTNISLTTDTFNKNRPQYNPNDKDMVKIFYAV